MCKKSERTLPTCTMSICMDDQRALAERTEAFSDAYHICSITILHINIDWWASQSSVVTSLLRQAPLLCCCCCCCCWCCCCCFSPGVGQPPAKAPKRTHIRYYANIWLHRRPGSSFLTRDLIFEDRIPDYFGGRLVFFFWKMQLQRIWTYIHSRQHTIWQRRIL